jgi:hypothetical protein
LAAIGRQLTFKFDKIVFVPQTVHDPKETYSTRGSKSEINAFITYRLEES